MVSVHYKTNLKAMSRWCLFTHLLEVAFPELVSVVILETSTLTVILTHDVLFHQQFLRHYWAI